MKTRVRRGDLHVLEMRTRMPFRYGIAELTALPHLFLRVEAEVGGTKAKGIAADGLAPKWFTKDPGASFRREIADMVEVIRSAVVIAEEIGEAPSPFDFWRDLFERQRRAMSPRGFPPLLWGFGVSLVERALIDATCRAGGVPFQRALREGMLGLRLGELHGELEGIEARDLLPPRPLDSVRLRHTVGLSDPLGEEEIPARERLEDGLPQSLAASIDAYGLSCLKVKLTGEPERDLERLDRIARLVAASGRRFSLTLDANEQFASVESFRAEWELLGPRSDLRDLLSGLLYVEQPLRREVALGAEARAALSGWRGRPPIVIDESDGDLDSARLALEAGYAGTTHKNCKGVFKGIASAAWIEHLRRRDPKRPLRLGAEDLASVGPVALQEDLAVVAALGIAHAERNGHHYFRGLSMYPEDIGRRVLDAHPDLYRSLAPDGAPSLRVRDGTIDLGSVNRAPFGVGIELDPSRFTPLEEWSFDSLGL